MSREPSLQFYPGDWLRDANLRRCTPATRGAWIDMLCLMFQCEQRGVLATGGEAWTHDEIARSLPGDTAENLAALKELLRNRVAYVDESGAIYSKRMVSDETERAKWRERQQRHREVTPQPLQPSLNGHGNSHDVVTAPVTPTSRPSSSSSSSSTSKKETANTAPAPNTGATVALPDWLPLEAWNAFLEMRKKKRTALTGYAVKLAIKNLEKLRAAGNDPKAVLDQSTLNGYQGLFELRVDFNAARTAERNRDARAGSSAPAARQQTDGEKAEMERTRIDVERWDKLEKGTLEVSDATVAWVTEKADRFRKAKLPATDPRPRWFRVFFDKAMPGKYPPARPVMHA